jgi:hypothetical protein
MGIFVDNPVIKWDDPPHRYNLVMVETGRPLEAVWRKNVILYYIKYGYHGDMIGMI